MWILAVNKGAVCLEFSLSCCLASVVVVVVRLLFYVLGCVASPGVAQFARIQIMWTCELSFQCLVTVSTTMTSVAANTNVSLGIYALTHPSGSCFSTVYQYLGISKVPFCTNSPFWLTLTVLSLPRSCLEVRKLFTYCVLKKKHAFVESKSFF